MTIEGHYHLAGAAGVGMSALAQVLLAQGCAVSGSDRYVDCGDDLEAVRKLRQAGVRFVPQDGSGITDRTRGLIVSSAIEQDNPEVTAARRAGVPVLHRAEMLARLVEGTRCVAVSGTSGKTTVTGMLGWILEQLGADPVVVNGGALVDWCTAERIGNVRLGRSALWVIEADESDRSLLRFHPDWAVVTNASQDHFSAEETGRLFREFAAQARAGALNMADDPALQSGFDPAPAGQGMRFRHAGCDYAVRLPGLHNAENALCAVAVCRALGFEGRPVAAALDTFRGIQRRLEHVGTAGGVRVIDDYAHNPAKIAAAWRAVAPRGGRVLAVWQPHGYRPLATAMDELARAFRAACAPGDRLYLLPVYDAGGTADRSVRVDPLAERLRAEGCPAELPRDKGEAVERVAADAGPGDTVLVMGARDPALPALSRAILARLGLSRRDSSGPPA